MDVLAISSDVVQIGFRFLVEYLTQMVSVCLCASVTELMNNSGSDLRRYIMCDFVTLA